MIARLPWFWILCLTIVGVIALGAAGEFATEIALDEQEHLKLPAQTDLR